MRLLSILALGCFVSSMSMRIIDPAVPDIARDLQVSAASVALLASAFTFPYALGQPLHGALGDALGKARIIKISLAVMMVCLAAAALAPTLDMLLIARVVGGAAGGGIIPLSFALVGDRFDMADRQVMLSRLLTAIIAGQITGSLGSGMVASAFGWRASLALGAALALAALVLTVWQLKARSDAARPPVRLAAMRSGYASVFRNPRTIVCFTAVFVEGIVVFGLFPYIAYLLEQRDAGGLFEAGLVLGGFAIGGFIYTALVGVLLNKFGLLNLIRIGGLSAGLGLALLAPGGSWPIELAVFVLIGVGFYMIHNSLQTQATELAPLARGSAVAAHAFFFFLGQAFGPIAYSLGFQAIGAPATLLVAGGVMAATGLATAAGLARRGAVGTTARS